MGATERQASTVLSPKEGFFVLCVSLSCSTRRRFWIQCPLCCFVGDVRFKSCARTTREAFKNLFFVQITPIYRSRARIFRVEKGQASWLVFPALINLPTKCTICTPHVKHNVVIRLNGSFFRVVFGVQRNCEETPEHFVGSIEGYKQEK